MQQIRHVLHKQTNRLPRLIRRQIGQAQMEIFFWGDANEFYNSLKLRGNYELSSYFTFS